MDIKKIELYNNCMFINEHPNWGVNCIIKNDYEYPKISHVYQRRFKYNLFGISLLIVYDKK